MGTAESREIEDRFWRLWGRLDALHHPERLSREQRAVFVLYQVWGGGDCLANYYNYGLTQFVAEVPDAARFIGAFECARLLERANGLFPKSALTQVGVIEYLESRLDEMRPELAALDDLFERLAASGDGLADHMARYARSHPLQFPEFATQSG